MKTKSQIIMYKSAQVFFYLQFVLLLLTVYFTITDYIENSKGGDIHDWVGWYLAFYWIGISVHYASVAVLSVIPYFIFFKHLTLSKKIVYLIITLFLLVEPLIVYQYYKSIPQNPPKEMYLKPLMHC